MRNSCTHCFHPVIPGNTCPFCSNAETVETCVECGTEGIKPPGAESSHCPLCAFESAVIER